MFLLCQWSVSVFSHYFFYIAPSREELDQFMNAVNSFHPALKYTCRENFRYFFIKVSIEGNGLCTSMHCKPTDSHSYLLYSSSSVHHMSRIPLLILSFLDLDFAVFLVRTLTFPLNQTKCAFSSTNVAILLPFSCLTGPSSRPTNGSAVSTTNVTEEN